MDFDDVWQIQADAKIIDLNAERIKRGLPSTQNSSEISQEESDEIDEAMRNHPAGKGKKESSTPDKVKLFQSAEDLRTHLAEGNHSFSAAATEIHLYPMQQKTIWLETRYASMDITDIQSLQNSIDNHLINLHIDAHENGPSSNGKEGSRFHIHFED